MVQNTRKKRRIQLNKKTTKTGEDIDSSSSLKKNLNASRLSEHPPVRGKNVKTFRWDYRLQIQHLNGFPDGSNIGSTV